MSQRRHAVETTAGRRRSGPTPPRCWPSSLPGPARRSSAMGCPMPNPIGPGLQRPSRQARRARRTALIGAPIRYQGRLPRVTFTKRENRIPDEAPRKLRIRRLSARGQTCTPMLDTLCGPNVRWRSFSNRSRIDSHGLAKSAKNQPNQRQLMFSVKRPFRRCGSCHRHAAARCSCDGTLKPGTCANGPKSVCAATGQDFHCFTCGDAGTDGLPCKGSGTCNQAQATCN